MTLPPLRALWLGAGWLGVTTVIFFSLVPNPPEVDLRHGDKAQHLLAYAALMLWFAQAQKDAATRWATALHLVVMGVSIELAQGLVGWRHLSAADMAANTLGVLLGWLAAPPRLPSLYDWASALVRR